MTAEDFSTNLKAALHNQQHYVHRSLITEEDAPTWGDFIAAMEDGAHRNSDVRTGNPILEHQINDLIVRGVFYSYVFLNDKDKETHFKALLPVQDLLRSVFPREIRTFNMATSFTNFISQDDYANIHNDIYTHNFYLQCHGSTEWRIYSERDPNTQLDMVVLTPGDAIFVPNEVFHSVKAQGPRAAVAFRLDIEDGPYDH